MSRPWEKKTMLVVDDSDEVRETLVRLYESLGIQVIAEAGDGLTALAKFRELKPDLVSLDIIMPEMNGVDCYRQMAAENANLKAVVVTFLARKALEFELTKTIPSYIFIEKPATEERIVSALGQIFASDHKAILSR